MTTTQRLTSTRIFAALSAVFFHAHWAKEAIPNQSFLNLIASGPTAVSYFFCLSGFVMAMVYQPDNFSTLKYWLARIARIYPVYLISLIWFACVSPLCPKPWILNLSLIQSWVPGQALSGNPPGWSLATEVAFYLSFPFFIKSLSKEKLAQTTVVVVFFWLFSQAMHEYAYATWYPDHPYPSAWHDTLFYSPVFHFNEFFLGAVIGAWSARQQVKPSYAFDVMSIVAMAGMMLPTAFQDRFRAWGWPVDSHPNGLLAPAMLAFIYALPRAKGIWARAFEWKPLLVLGEASYAVYLLQIPLLYSFNRFGLAQSLGISSALGTLLLYVFLLIAISVIVWRTIEDPARSFIRKLGKGREYQGVSVDSAAISATNS